MCCTNYKQEGSHMNRETAYVLWFDELKREDVNLVGGNPHH